MTVRTKSQKAEQEEARAKLRELLPPGSKVYTILRHVSASGMTRHISCVILAPADEYRDSYTKAEIRDITWYVGRALNLRRNDRDGGLVIGGCGMDMGFHLVHSLSYALHGHNQPTASPEKLDALGVGPTTGPKWKGIGAHAGTDDRYQTFPPDCYHAGYTLTHEWL